MNPAQTIRIVNPVGEGRRPELTLAPRLRTLKGASVGIIHNTKHMAGEFLAELRRLLQERYGVAKFEFYRKEHASVPIPEKVLRSLVESCGAIVHGVAD